VEAWLAIFFQSFARQYMVSQLRVQYPAKCKLNQAHNWSVS